MPILRSDGPITPQSMLVAARRLGWAALFVVFPLLVSVSTFGLFGDVGVLGFDFEGTIWRPLHAVLSGTSPYPPATERGVDIGNPTVYPPLTFLMALPLAPLPFWLAAASWMIVLATAVGLAMHVLGVRDWRCYVLAGSSFPVLYGLGFGNATLLLPLGVALAWRFRDRVWLVGSILGVTIALKVFLWPLLAWLVFTRRSRAAVVAALAAGAALVVPWSLIGFDGMAQYPDLLGVVTRLYGEHSISLFAAAIELGMSSASAKVVAALLGVLVLVLVFVLARREGGGAASLAAAIAAALVFSPVVWHHYFALLVVAIGVLSPAYGRLWLVFPASTLMSLLLPWGDEGDPVCCRPVDVPEKMWTGSHADPALWHIAGFSFLLVVLLAAAAGITRRPVAAPAV